MKILTAATILFIWFFASVSIIIFTIFQFPIESDIKGLNLLIASSSKNIFAAPTSAGENFGSVLAAVQGGDARPVLVERFLEKYNSPMVGLGKEFVEAADKNNLDWRLLPALAFQESNLGKKIPKGSHNPFGWAIYEGKDAGAYFSSWEEAIAIVAIRMRENYISNGFNTPETIVIKYTSGKDTPAWVFAVRSAMEEIAPTTY